MLLPENAVVRRINELVKRARSVKVHAYIIHYLRKQMPYMMGKQEKQVRSPLPLPRVLLPLIRSSAAVFERCLEIRLFSHVLDPSAVLTTSFPRSTG